MRVAAPQYRAKLSAVVASAFDVDVLHARISQIEGVLDQADDSDEALVWERDDATHHMDDPRDFVTERRAYLVDALGPN